MDTSRSMVNGSGNCGLRPGTHFHSGDSAFHRWTCASTIMRRSACAAARGAACVASSAPAPSELLMKLRLVGMDLSSLFHCNDVHSTTPPGGAYYLSFRREQQR